MSDPNMTQEQHESWEGVTERIQSLQSEITRLRDLLKQVYEDPHNNLTIGLLEEIKKLNITLKESSWKNGR